MTPEETDRLIDEHIEAESKGDLDGAVAMYTEDVEHDVVGFPTGPVHGKAAAQGFYGYLTQNVDVEEMAVKRSFYGDDFCVLEHVCTCTVPGEFFGMAGHGNRIAFRMLHVWEFRDGLMSRENVWVDGAAVAAQLTAPQAAATRA